MIYAWYFNIVKHQILFTNSHARKMKKVVNFKGGVYMLLNLQSVNNIRELFEDSSSFGLIFIEIWDWCFPLLVCSNENKKWSNSDCYNFFSVSFQWISKHLFF